MGGRNVPRFGNGSPAILRSRLLGWYAKVRRDLPWRRTRDAYAVWLSETMLQQTRVETVVPYFERFLRQLPDVGALAEAPVERVLALWSGLGYYRRARMLHTAAQRIAREHRGRMPSDVQALRALEGVGAYTAGAVASIAFGRREACVDGNIARVLARLFAVEDSVDSARGNARIWSLARQLLPEGDGDPGDWNQALMELGATICVPTQPRCIECPLVDSCHGYQRGLTGDLPRKAPKRPPKPTTRVAIVLASPVAVLLARRRATVLFGGLWEPPCAEENVGELAARLGVVARDLRRAGEVVHVLSHRRMTVEVLCGTLGRRRRFPLPGPDYDAVQAVALDRLAERAHATLTAKILAVANVPARGLRSSIR